MSHPTDLWVVGDVHGECGKLRTLLQGADLICADGTWTGGEAHLAFLGDYLDRGPDGLGVVRLVRRLEEEAPRSGGRVTALLGNHEVMFLAAEHFRRADPGDRFGFQEYWEANGGQVRDAEGLHPGDLAWLAARPALARVGRWLLLHADSPMYLHLGGSVEAVNARVAALLASHSPEVWGGFANAFADRLAFVAPDGEETARRLLGTFGGDRLAHGHTPVFVLLDEDGPDEGLPAVYAGGRCVALDSGMAYRKDAGFIARLDGRGVAEVVVLSQG
ncbi:metallophosphoesterase [Deinococcus planocerae]|uniref:metallophosphoesterase n=1 Tax=Deinococcus planocerae TaxID=1737569 RepID=UPI000C7F55BA|nr:metallophosphoesterase [Deinococcus planocerae]